MTELLDYKGLDSGIVREKLDHYEVGPGGRLAYTTAQGNSGVLGPAIEWVIERR